MFYQFNHLGSPDYIKIEKGINFNFPPHLHQCFEIIIVISGEMKVTINNKDVILKEGKILLDDKAAYDKMAKAANPYGDGNASERIVKAILSRFANGERPEDFQ